MTSPAQRTLPASIAVAMETVGVGQSVLFPLATDRKIEAQGGRIRSNSLGRKKVCKDRGLSLIRTFLGGDLLHLPLGPRDSVSSLPPDGFPKPCLLLGNHY